MFGLGYPGYRPGGVKRRSSGGNRKEKKKKFVRGGGLKNPSARQGNWDWTSKQGEREVGGEKKKCNPTAYTEKVLASKSKREEKIPQPGGGDIHFDNVDWGESNYTHRGLSRGVFGSF